MNGPFDFLNRNRREPKPRRRGLTEIRGPYYSAFGPRALEDVLELAHPYVDSLKFAGGSFALLPEDTLGTLIELAHGFDVTVSTGGFVERVLTQGGDAVEDYFSACAEVGFDVVELSAGFLTLPADDWVGLVERVRAHGLTPKPEVGVQFGAGGDTPGAQLAAEGLQDPEWAIQLIERFLEAGAPLVMIESEGITENADPWRTDVVARIIGRVGMERVMFEAADPAVFAWYVKNYGPDVNLFVDHSQIVQLEALRQGLWGTHSLWGRVVTHGP